MRLIRIIGFALLAVAPTAFATSVRQMNLAELSTHAQKIFRGTVVAATPGQIAIGGGMLPTVSYRVIVEEAFKGDFETVSEHQVAEITMIGKFRPVRVGPYERVVAISKLPEISVGESYVFLTTAPSVRGLSTTVGLGQGLFRIIDGGKTELAINDANNVGLFRAMAAPSKRGALPYPELAARIKSLGGK